MRQMKENNLVTGTSTFKIFVVSKSILCMRNREGKCDGSTENGNEIERA